MKPLEPPDSMQLSAAIGWLGLGNWQEASVELNGIRPALREHPDVLAVRHEVCVRAKDWDSAAEICYTLTTLNPLDPHPVIAFAYAVRRKNGGGIEKAKIILEAAHKEFPRVATIAYNLACYECQLGDLDKARAWLQKASELGGPEDIKRLALEDQDLEPLHGEIRHSDSAGLK